MKDFTLPRAMFLLAKSSNGNPFYLDFSSNRYTDVVRKCGYLELDNDGNPVVSKLPELKIYEKHWFLISSTELVDHVNINHYLPKLRTVRGIHRVVLDSEQISDTGIKYIIVHSHNAIFGTEDEDEISRVRELINEIKATDRARAILYDKRNLRGLFDFLHSIGCPHINVQTNQAHTEQLITEELLTGVRIVFRDPVRKNTGEYDYLMTIIKGIKPIFSINAHYPALAYYLK